MSVIPDNLREIYQQLQGYKKMLVRFYGDRQNAIYNGDVIRWTFPKEIVDLDSLLNYFEFTSTPSQSGTTAPLRRGTYFPRNTASIIDTLTVFINGQVYENITSYNHLFNLIYDNTTGFNYYGAGSRALECVDPSIRYTLSATAETLTAAVQGSGGASDAAACDNKRPLHIRNWIGFLDTCPRIVDLTNCELIVEYRLASANIMFNGIDGGGTTTTLTPTFSIDNYYMTINKINFEDDTYQRALNSLKNSGSYILTFKTFSSARSSTTTKASNPTLQFSTTAKYLSKLYLTVLDKDYDTMTYLLNQGTSSTVVTPAFNALVANPATNLITYNQSRYFQKNASGLKEAQVEVNGSPVFPFPMPPHLIKANNIEAFGLEGDKHAGEFIGLPSLESWTKYGFIQAVSFEHKDAWKNKIISGYPNPSGNLLTIKWTPTFDSGNTNNTTLLGYAERVVQAIFEGNNVRINY
jgi:hypothetical protein